MVTELCMYIALYDTDPENRQGARICLLIAINLYLLFYAAGISTTPQAVNFEIFTIYLIGTANGLAATTNLASSFVVAS
jgi:hypothetical protein